MKVTQLVFDSQRMYPQYPYHYRVELSSDLLNQRDKIVVWANTNDFPCTIVGEGIYVRDIEATTMFLLRWS